MASVSQPTIVRKASPAPALLPKVGDWVKFRTRRTQGVRTGEVKGIKPSGVILVHEHAARFLHSVGRDGKILEILADPFADGGVDEAENRQANADLTAQMLREHDLDTYIEQQTWAADAEVVS